MTQTTNRYAAGDRVRVNRPTLAGEPDPRHGTTGTVARVPGDPLSSNGKVYGHRNSYSVRLDGSPYPMAGFAEHHLEPHDGDPTADRLYALYLRREAVSKEITQLHLRHIAEGVRRAHPQAAEFELYWSDQGDDEWHYRTAYDATGAEIADADRLDQELFSFYIDAQERGIWAALTTTPDAFDDYDRSPDLARFDIAAVLTATAGV